MGGRQGSAERNPTGSPAADEISLSVLSGGAAQVHPGETDRSRAVPIDQVDGGISGRARRLVNVLVAVLALTLCLPVMALVALLIKLTSDGPVFYVQTRVGLDRRNGRDGRNRDRRKRDLGGKPFRIYKFRTMHVRPPGRDSRETWTAPEDGRVTGLGRILRQYRLDELPQLVNVLQGDMNIVGPRPEQPEIFSRLRSQLRQYPRRQNVRPGITGWAQINHHYDRSIDDVRKKLNLDLEYIRRCSAWQDLRIMARTIPVMLLRRGGW